MWFVRLQTGMRGAYGKPNGLAARVKIGQILVSCRTRPQYEAQIVEAFRRCKFKFPGRQLIVKSKKWGFTNHSVADFLQLKDDNKVCLRMCMFACTIAMHRCQAVVLSGCNPRLGTRDACVCVSRSFRC